MLVTLRHQPRCVAGYAECYPAERLQPELVTERDQNGAPENAREKGARFAPDFVGRPSLGPWDIGGHVTDRSPTLWDTRPGNVELSLSVTVTKSPSSTTAVEVTVSEHRE